MRYLKQLSIILSGAPPQLTCSTLTFSRAPYGTVSALSRHALAHAESCVINVDGDDEPWMNDFASKQAASLV